MIKLVVNKNIKKYKGKKIVKTSVDVYGIEKRFDLGAKYFYVKCKLNNINTLFYKELYHQHMITFNNCIEKNSHKNKIEYFFSEFDNLINNMQKYGFNIKYPIPLGNNNVIINGSHRLITSKVLNIKPSITNEDKNAYEYDYDFFINRNKYSSKFINLNTEYADFIALNNLELLKENNNVRAIIIYPVANKLNKTKEIESILRKNGAIMYKKNIHLTEKGVKNLIIELYRGEKWIGGLFPKNDNNAKFKECYIDYPIIYYMYYFNDPTQDIIIKEKIRNLFNLKKNSIHITDDYIDTFRVSTALLNHNSIKFLNYGTNIISENSKNLLIKYFYNINNNENYIVTSSIILELFDLRQAKDLDYIHLYDNKLNIDNISPHTEKWLNYYPITKDELIYNPDNYFYLNGHKFISLNILKLMKDNRKETKDISDLDLIKTVNF